MKLLITGAKGFVGRNLTAFLSQREGLSLLEYDVDTKASLLEDYAAACDFVFHLAGVNRPDDEAEFMKGNFGFTMQLLAALERAGSKAPVLITSSIQAALDNPYGKSKRAGEELVFEYGRRNAVKTLVYRLPNLFGKWCRPNYNSVVATFCHNIARGLPVTVDDPEKVLQLCYIDDVAAEFIRALSGLEHRDGAFCSVQACYHVRLGDVVSLLRDFENSRRTLCVPDQKDSFIKKLYATYLSYLPEDGFSYPLSPHTDARGSFTEALKSEQGGQISINVAKPGVIKGNHWHHTKSEKFLVVSGRGVIRFRKIDEARIYEYHVHGGEPLMVDIPPGYTHNIENVGDTDLVTVMWCNELFDPDNPDTYSLQV